MFSFAGGVSFRFERDGCDLVLEVADGLLVIGKRLLDEATTSN